MAALEPHHSYGPTCAFYDDSKRLDDNAASTSEDAPRVKAQFFYVSALPIDDPLSPLPAISSTQTTGPPQPFSARDNAALEEVWMGLQQGDEKNRDGSKKSGGEEAPRGRKGGLSGKSEEAVKVKAEKAAKQGKKNQNQEEGYQTFSQTLRQNTQSGESDPTVLLGDYPEHHDRNVGVIPVNARELARAKQVDAPVPKKKERSPKRTFSKKSQELKTNAKSKKSPTRAGEMSVADADDAEEEEEENCGEETDGVETKRSSSRSWLPSRRLPSPFRRKSKAGLEVESSPEPKSATKPDDSPNRAEDISGNPFARAPSRSRKGAAAAMNVDGADDEKEADAVKTYEQDMAEASGEGSKFRPKFKQLKTENFARRSDSESPSRGKKSAFKTHKNKTAEEKTAYVPVGVSRLHLVEMPSLQMKPIYWNPIHDISSVVRGTWFYKTSMLPVEPVVGILLEVGYEDMRPWTDAYQEELNSCVKNGAEAELKIVHRLWPKQNSRPGTAGKEPQNATTNDVAETSSKPSVPQNQAAGSSGVPEAQQRLFKNSSIIYVNVRDAQILRPSFLPSVSRGRKPLSGIRAGRQIGVPVVRGFNRAAWDKLHPPKETGTAQPPNTAHISRSGAAMTDDQPKWCAACEKDEERLKVTDLILVIHGIGQKMAERVESFHFTHAINSFRRQVNVELACNEVKPHLRPGLGGMMVLPINWRSTVELDDGEELSKTESGHTENSFTLKDITQDSLPAVRNLISDVMLDIPYYLSHHRPKMINAVIKEANRIYRLWCRNNPSFHEHGRVHLIAHSLGSSMAMDILSKQPTKLPQTLNLNTNKVSSETFEFDTKNLFFCGSPAGFFLLLNKAHLLPRKGRDKPGASPGEDTDPKIVGDLGTYGCLAVDNLYNVMHYNDPIAYRVNAAVDTDYAASLKTAHVPSTSSSWFAPVYSLFQTPQGQWSAASTTALAVDRPRMNKMPSTIEMETHDFTREEIAEKRMGLLNDNGQIDYVLSSGGGPLEIQYLNMLGAHSSYWILRDFVRFLVVECGREPGGRNSLGVLRAGKRGALGRKK